jgi:hypothetical protein
MHGKTAIKKNIYINYTLFCTRVRILAKRGNLLSINTVRPILLLCLICVSSVECSKNVERDNGSFEKFDEIRYLEHQEIHM